MFALLADGARWSDWAGPFVPRSSWQVPGDPVGSVGAVRRLGIGALVSLERIVEHDPPHRLAYVVDSWSPYWGYRATVDLVPTIDGGTRILWRAGFTPKVRGTGALLQWFLSSVVGGFAGRLARAADGQR